MFVHCSFVRAFSFFFCIVGLFVFCWFIRRALLVCLCVSTLLAVNSVVTIKHGENRY